MCWDLHSGRICLGACVTKPTPAETSADANVLNTSYHVLHGMHAGVIVQTSCMHPRVPLPAQCACKTTTYKPCPAPWTSYVSCTAHHEHDVEHVKELWVCAHKHLACTPDASVHDDRAIHRSTGHAGAQLRAQVRASVRPMVFPPLQDTNM